MMRLVLAASLVSMATAAITAAEKQQMLNEHNKYRCMAGVPDLIWDNNLAQKAQSWADTKPMGHSTALGAFKWPDGYGENMRMKCPSCSPKEAMDWWYAEKAKYNAANPMASMGAASHYTQVVWKGSTHVGCGKVKMNAFGCNGEQWVCQYKPMGNVNMGTEAKNNVFAPKKTAGACAASKLYSDIDVGIPADESGASTMAGFSASTMAGFAVLAAALFALGVVIGYRRKNQALPVDANDEEPVETLIE
jgi:hypothetical protein